MRIASTAQYNIWQYLGHAVGCAEVSGKHTPHLAHAYLIFVSGNRQISSSQFFGNAADDEMLPHYPGQAISTDYSG